MSEMTSWETAQVAVIGSVLLKPELAGQLVADTGPEDFDGPGRACFLGLQGLFRAGTPIDPVTLMGAVGEQYREYIFQCLEVTPTAANFSAYVPVLRQRARAYRIREIANRMILETEPDKLEPLVREAYDEISGSTGIRSVPIADGLLSFYKRKERGETYLPTGLRRLDAEVFLRPGAYVVLAARPSRGKTALALQMALEQSKEHRVGFYSLETDTDTLMDRIAAHAAGVSMEKIMKASLSEQEWNDMGNAATRVSQRSLELIPASGLTVDQIYAHAQSRRFEIVYIDYLQLIASADRRADRYDAVTEISRRIHELSQTRQVVTVALSQLSRSLTANKTEEPQMSDLRESGQIEQDADVILMLYCQTKNDLEGPRELKIAKNKQGVTGYIKLDWSGETQTFTALSKREYTMPRTYKEPKSLPKDTPVPFEQQTMEELPY